MIEKQVKVAIVRRDKVPGALIYDYTEKDVQIVKGMIKEAIDLSVGGIDKIVFPGDRVILKPNVLNPVHIKWGICTDPRIVEALILLIKESVNPVKVSVAENSSMGSSTLDAYKGAGIDIAAKRAGAELICLEDTSVVEVEIPKAKYWIGENPKIFKPLLDADIVINLPKLKTHFMTSLVTLGIKNWQGIIPFGPGKNVSEQQQGGHGIDIDQKVVDLHRVVRADLTIADGLVAMEGQGAMAGDLVNMNLIIAGSDVVAVDAVSAAVMGFDPLREVGSIRIANFEELGIGDLSKIEVLGTTIEKVRRVFKRAVWDSVGEFPNWIIYNKGSNVCDIAIPRCIGDFIRFQIKLGIIPKDSFERIGRLIFLIGKGPFPEPDALPTGKIFIIGDDVQLDTVKTFQEKRNASYYPGSETMWQWHPIKNELLPLLGLKEWPAWIGHGM